MTENLILVRKKIVKQAILQGEEMTQQLWRPLISLEEARALRLLGETEKVRMGRLGSMYEGYVRRIAPIEPIVPVYFSGRQLRDDEPVGEEISVWVGVRQISTQRVIGEL